MRLRSRTVQGEAQPEPTRRHKTFSRRGPAVPAIGEQHNAACTVLHAYDGLPGPSQDWGIAHQAAPLSEPAVPDQQGPACTSLHRSAGLGIPEPPQDLAMTQLTAAVSHPGPLGRGAVEAEAVPGSGIRQRVPGVYAGIPLPEPSQESDNQRMAASTLQHVYKGEIVPKHPQEQATAQHTIAVSDHGPHCMPHAKVPIQLQGPSQNWGAADAIAAIHENAPRSVMPNLSRAPQTTGRGSALLQLQQHLPLHQLPAASAVLSGKTQAPIASLPLMTQASSVHSCIFDTSTTGR